MLNRMPEHIEKRTVVLLPQFTDCICLVRLEQVYWSTQGKQSCDPASFKVVAARKTVRKYNSVLTLWTA